MPETEKSCGPQLFVSETPTEQLDIDQLGELAATEHQAIVHEENSLAPRYWRLGESLNLARSQIRRGEWSNYLEKYSIDKTRASKARAIHRTFKHFRDLEGLTVEEAYARRARRGGQCHSDDLDLLEQFVKSLQGLNDLTEEIAADVASNSLESIEELLSKIVQAVKSLQHLQQVVQRHFHNPVT